jgi:cyclopropane-fatty-acyl-phospholipid synthase
MRLPDITPLLRTHTRQSLAPPAVLRELARSTGVTFNGDAPWDIQVHDPLMYQRILTRGSLGFGEAYVDGMWDSQRLDQLFHRLLRGNIDQIIRSMTRWRVLANLLRHRLYNLQSPQRAFQVGERHYDIGNDVFEAMLDSRMI